MSAHKPIYSREMDIGELIARRAGQLAMSHWDRGIAFEEKPDDSPVTVADRESERLIVRLLEECFPDDGMLGEEGARKESASGRRWIIDPIDGTRDFVRGNPLWAVLIGFEAAREVEAGIAYLPAMNLMFRAARGAGAYCNDNAIHASATSGPSRAVFCMDGLNNVGKYSFAPCLVEWMKQFWAVRSLGGCLDAMMVARGQADLWMEPSGQPWDFAPLKVIAEEAGARFFNFDGGSSIYGGNCVVAAPGLEGEARRLLGLTA